MKILLCITGLGIGGAERQVIDLADGFVSRGHEVMIVALTGDAVVKPVSDKIRVELLDVNNTPRGFVSAYVQLRKHIRAFSPDIVHSHMIHANILTRLIRLSTPMPRLICTAHSTNEGGALRMLAYRLTHSLANVTTSVSSEGVVAFEAKGAARPGAMVTVYNGIDPNRFYRDVNVRQQVRESFGVQPLDKVIIAVSRLVEVKDYPNLLNAFKMVSEEHDGLHLWVVGDGHLLDHLKHRAAALGIADRVMFLGSRTDIPDLLNAADIFALSSVLEGFGLVVAEAMACEKLVIATDCGGVAEVVGECGFIVPPCNSSALADALHKALSVPDDVKLLIGEKARRRVVTKFSLGVALDRWFEIYGHTGD